MDPEKESKPVMVTIRLTGEEALSLKKNWRYDMNSENKSDYVRNAIRFYENHLKTIRQQEATEGKNAGI